MEATARLFAVILLLTSAVGLHGAERITRPFELVPLWSEEMIGYLTGSTQPSCSGPNAGTCERLNTGICDGATYFTLPPYTPGLSPKAPYHAPAKQTNAANPQFFGILIGHANSSDHAHHIVDQNFQTIDLLFDCQYSGNDACPTSRLHVGAVQAIEIGLASGEKTVNLTHSATVLPEGKVAVAVDGALRRSLFADTRALYKVRAVVECFTVRPSPVEWTFPVREAPSPESRALGTVIARLIPGSGLNLVYRPNDGQDVALEADWVEEDWGYTYLQDQTILDRKGDWFLLPRRPFRSAVWIHLAGRTELSTVSDGTVYSLSKKVAARERGASRTVTFDAGNIVVVARHGRTLEIRKEEDFDGPCAGSDARRDSPKKLRTYLAEAEEFYDSDLHLQIKPAYTKGC